MGAGLDVPASLKSPLKVGGSESMYRMGGRPTHPPLEKPERISLGFKRMFIAQFSRPAHEKKLDR